MIGRILASIALAVPLFGLAVAVEYLARWLTPGRTWRYWAITLPLDFMLVVAFQMCLSLIVWR